MSETSNTMSTSSVSKKVFMKDGVGFVELLESFGNDLTVVNAARVSFDKESYELTLGDEKLIKYLAKRMVSASNWLCAQ